MGFFIYTRDMSKKQKKRTKRYQGDDAKQATQSGPVIHRYEAVQRTKAGEWWHTRKRSIKVTGLIVGAVAIIAWLVTELIRIVL